MINKQALLESVNNRIEWFRARSKGWKDQGYDTKAHEYYECSIALEEIKDEIQSGRFDITDEDGEPIDFIKEIDTAYGLASKHQDEIQQLQEEVKRLEIALYTHESYDKSVSELYQETDRLRAALVAIKPYIDEDFPNGPDGESDATVGYRLAYKKIVEALSTTEPTGVERVRERYKNAERLNATTSGATAEYYLGVMNGITDTLNDFGITIPGINAPEKGDNTP